MVRVAKTIAEVGKAPIDFQSFNHVICGYVSFLLLYLCNYYFLPFLDGRGYILAISIFSAVFWEVLENVLWTNAFFRVWGMDSIENSLADIVFNTIGACMCFCVSFTGDMIFPISIIVIVSLVWCMYVCLRFTKK